MANLYHLQKPNDFDYRYNSSDRFAGVPPLISGIESTRKSLDDFSPVLTDKAEVCDTVCLISWEINGNRKSDGDPFKSNGFSVIFHSQGLINGEWISFSDIGWVTGMGYKLTPAENISNSVPAIPPS